MNDSSQPPVFGQQPHQPLDEPPHGVGSSGGKRKIILLLIVILVIGGAAAAIVLGGLLGSDDKPSGEITTQGEPAPGFGMPDNTAPIPDGAPGAPEEGPYESLEQAPATPAPVAPGEFDEARYTQECTDKFNNDIRARGQNPDDFDGARREYVTKCVEYVRQQMTGQQ
jgi:hypothetical protein